MSRSKADDTGVTRFEAAYRQWIALDSSNLDPRPLMDDEDFAIAKDYMETRLKRMWRAMLTVFPILESRLIDGRYDLNRLQRDFIANYFEITKNRVWKLITHPKGLTQMRFRLEEFLDLQKM